MSTTTHGPVELYLFGLAGEHPDAATVEAVNDLVASNLIRLLDVVLIHRGLDGEVTHVGWENTTDGFGLDPTAPDAPGIAGHDDLNDLAGAVAPGSSALLVVVELTFQKRLAATIAQADGQLLAYERIPAPIVDALSSEGEWRMPLYRRFGRPGLIGLAARTAVAAGTATAVSGAVAGSRQRKNAAEAERQQYEAAQQQAQIYDAAQQAVNASAPAPQPQATGDIADELQKLAALKQSGALSDAEFAAAKSRLLG